VVVFEPVTLVSVLPLESYVYVVLGVEVSSFDELFVYGETPSDERRLPTGSLCWARLPFL
jgi:hypothetical protein